jgi:hypothetical protein
MGSPVITYVRSNRRLAPGDINPSVYDLCVNLVKFIVHDARCMWRISGDVRCAYFASAQKRNATVALHGDPYVLFDENLIRVLMGFQQLAKDRDAAGLKYLVMRLLKEQFFVDGEIDQAMAFHICESPGELNVWDRNVVLDSGIVGTCLFILAHELFHVELYRNKQLANEIRANIPDLYPLFVSAFNALIQKDNTNIKNTAIGLTIDSPDSSNDSDQRLQRCWDEIRNYFGNSWEEAACDGFALQVLYQYWNEHGLPLHQIMEPMSYVSYLNNVIVRIRIVKDYVKGSTGARSYDFHTGSTLTRLYLLCFWLEMQRPNSAELFRFHRAFGGTLLPAVDRMVSDVLLDRSLLSELRYVSQIKFDSSDISREGEGFLKRLERCAEFLGYGVTVGAVKTIDDGIDL